jgi:phosphonate transport system substrate-binding protein
LSVFLKRIEVEIMKSNPLVQAGPVAALTLALSFALAAPVAMAQAAKGQRPTLAVAFPKTYNRIETMRLYGGYLQELARCAKVDLVNVRGEPIADRFDAVDILPEAELLAHMKAGKLQLAQFTTGLVPVAADTANGEPFAVRGHGSTGKYDVYELHLIVRADSKIRKPRDLVGTKIAHSTQKSNSGNLAPRAYFPTLGLVPEHNYEVVFSGGHERSIMGLQHGFWQGAAVASDQFERMAKKGEIKAKDFRVLWKSEPFPVESWVLSRQVAPEVAARVRQCTYAFRFPAEASRLLEGADRFVPIDPDKAYSAVRFVLERTRQQ